MEHGEERAEVGGQRIDDRGQAVSHMLAASLGHYASLSFLVIGRRWDWGFRIEDVVIPRGVIRLRSKINQELEFRIQEAKA